MKRPGICITASRLNLATPSSATLRNRTISPVWSRAPATSTMCEHYAQDIPPVLPTTPKSAISPRNAMSPFPIRKPLNQATPPPAGPWCLVLQNGAAATTMQGTINFYFQVVFPTSLPCRSWTKTSATCSSPSGPARNHALTAIVAPLTWAI